MRRLFSGPGSMIATLLLLPDDVGAGAGEGERPGIVADDAAHQRRELHDAFRRARQISSRGSTCRHRPCARHEPRAFSRQVAGLLKVSALRQGALGRLRRRGSCVNAAAASRGQRERCFRRPRRRRRDSAPIIPMSNPPYARPRHGLRLIRSAACPVTDRKRAPITIGRRRSKTFGQTMMFDDACLVFQRHEDHTLPRNRVAAARAPGRETVRRACARRACGVAERTGSPALETDCAGYGLAVARVPARVIATSSPLRVTPLRVQCGA